MTLTSFFHSDLLITDSWRSLETSKQVTNRRTRETECCLRNLHHLGPWNSKSLETWCFMMFPYHIFTKYLSFPKKVKWGSALAESAISWYFHHPWSDQDNFGAGSPGPWRWCQKKTGPNSLDEEDCSNKTSQPSQEFLLYWTNCFEQEVFVPHPQSKYTTWKVDTHWFMMAPYKNPHYSVTGWKGCPRKLVNC